MNDPLGTLGGVLRSMPIAVVTYRTEEGGAGVRATTWVGVASSRPPLLSVCLPRPLGDRRPPSGGSGPGEFAVNLLSSRQLAVPGLMNLILDGDARRLEAAGLTLGEGTMTAAPLLVDSPVRFECREAEALAGCSRTIVRALVAAVHIDGRVYGLDQPPDPFMLRPFSHPLLPFPPDRPAGQAFVPGLPCDAAESPGF